MACLNVLKQEIKVIEATFPKDHDRFQVHLATVDEVICKFVGPTGRQFEIIGNITVSFSSELSFSFSFCYCYHNFFSSPIEQETYPSTPPVWFADTDDSKVTNAIEKLGETTGHNNHVSTFI